MLFQEFQNYQVNIEMHSLIFETDKIAISPLFQEFQNYQANIETHSLIFETNKTVISPLFQEFQNYQANIETHSLLFETDKTEISPPPYPKPGVSGNLLFQFLMVCTTIMKLYKYVPTDVRQ